MQFVDKARIVIKAGDGGDGCASFHREKFVTRGGPDGGDGGRGGNVVFVADSNMDTLLDFKFARFYRAENGEKGRAARSSGKNGQDLIIKVPVGTLVRDVETGAIAADLNEPGRRKIVLHGGRGGKGNSRFATPSKQAPRFAQPGQKTLEREVELELKTIADVGLIGLPNVGKSTIINQLHGGAIAQVGNRPGVTRANQWVRVGEYLEVLDTPGLLWPKLDDPVAARRLAYISAIRDEVVDTFALSCALLEDMTALAPEALTARYKITDMSLRGQALLEAVCRGRGFLLRGGELDIERASAVVLDEFRDGKLGRLTLEAPPETAEKAPVKENNDDAQ